jgi:hypothetical protein
MILRNKHIKKHHFIRYDLTNELFFNFCNELIDENLIYG